MRGLGLAIVGASALFAVEGKQFDPPTGPAVEAHAALTSGLAESEDSAASPDEKVEALSACIARAIKLLEPHSPAQERLQTAIRQASGDSVSNRYVTLYEAIDSVAGELAFQPKFEASLPAGFPTYTPVGAIEVKKYPTYRMASGDNFWTLFQHIQQNQIEMTAPVQMNFTSGEQGEMRESKMSFLYGRREIGNPGVQGKVNVVDNPPHSVVSLGMRGARSKEALKDARNRLQRWIENNKNYEAEGTMRVMGYNSPAVPRSRQFFEVQVPIKKITKTASVSDGP